MKKTKRLFVLPVILLLIILLALGALSLHALADDSLTGEGTVTSVDLPFYIVHAADAFDALSTNIGITPYSTLQDAINAAVDGDTIYITEQAVSLDAALIISSGRSITLSAAGDAAASGVTIVSASDVRHMMVSGTGNITLTFNNVTLDGGNRSGGISTTAGSLTLSGVAIRNCYSAVSGGGINSYSDLKITGDSVISGNTTYYGGGGVFVANSTFEMVGGTISGNTANYGGGIHVYTSGTVEILGNSVISGNTAVRNGAEFPRRMQPTPT